VASGDVADWLDDGPDRFGVPEFVDWCDVLDGVVAPDVLVPDVGVDAWASEAS
jgi:hypothetical protein